MFKQVRLLHPDVTILAYLDDIYLIGNQEAVDMALDELIEGARAIDLSVNLVESKCLTQAVLEEGGGIMAVGSMVGGPFLVQE